MELQNNPLRELSNIITTIKQIQMNNIGLQTILVMHNKLDEFKFSGSIYEFVSHIETLYEDAYRVASSSEDRLLLQAKPKLKLVKVNVVDPIVRYTFEQYKAQIPDQLGTELGLLADIFGLYYKVESNHSDEEIESFIDKIQRLIIEIGESQIDVELKRFILNTLFEIQKILTHYNYVDDNEVEVLINSAIGGLYRYQDEITVTLKNEDNRQLFQSFIKNLELFNTLFSVVTNAKLLAAPVVATIVKQIG